MNAYEKLIRELHEWKVSRSVEEEKAYLKEMTEEYKRERQKLQASIASIFYIARNKGVIRSEDLFKYGRIDKAEMEVAAALSSLNKLENQKIKKQMSETLRNSIASSALLYNQFGYDKNITINNDELNEIITKPWAGETYAETLKRRKQAITSQIKREMILNSSGAGTTQYDLNQVIDKRLEKSLQHSLLVLQNEKTRLDNEGESLTADKLGVKTKQRWLAAFDDRTCSLCSPLDGEEFEEEDLPMIPVHPRCRCTTVHLIDDWDQTLRSARDLNTMKTYLTDARNIEEYRKQFKI